MKEQGVFEKHKKPFEFGLFFAKFFPFLGLILVIIFFTLVTNFKFIDSKNIMRIIVQALPLIVGTIGATFVLSQNILDMSMGSVLGLTSALVAYASKINSVLAIAMVFIVGISLGLVNGLFHGVLKINPLISTMAVSFIIRGLMQPICNYGSVGLSPAFLQWNNNVFKILLVAIIFVFAWIAYEYTGLGKKCKIVGSSEIVANQCGVNVRRIKITGYVITGMAAAIAGFLNVIRSGSVVPSSGTLFEFDVLIALVIGGMPITGGSESKMRSAIIGAFVLTILTNGMTLWGIEEYPQQLTKGIILFAVLAISFTFKKKK